MRPPDDSVPSWREQEAINETVFREMNEWTMEAMDARAGPPAAGVIEAYLCECSDARCTKPIGLTRDEYEAVRAVPVRFAIAPNHEDPEIDRVLLEAERFTTIDKFYPPAAEIARSSDPRRVT